MGKDAGRRKQDKENRMLIFAETLFHSLPVDTITNDQIPITSKKEIIKEITDSQGNDNDQIPITSEKQPEKI